MLRDKATGHFIHQWAVVDQVGNVEQCQVCGQYRHWVVARWFTISEEDALALLDGRTAR